MVKHNNTNIPVLVPAGLLILILIFCLTGCNNLSGKQNSNRLPEGKQEVEETLFVLSITPT